MTEENNTVFVEPEDVFMPVMRAGTTVIYACPLCACLVHTSVHLDGTEFDGRSKHVLSCQAVIAT